MARGQDLPRARQGEPTPVYAGTIEGGVETAGQQLFACAVRAGFGANSHVHAVGDGAPWIVGQVEEQFGAQGSYLIDFYHVCEYLSAAAKAIVPDAAAQEAWMDAQKDALKTGRLDQVLRALAGHIEPPEVDDDQAPVRRCHRYLSDRRNHLNYRDALANDLPIGSGEIESAHRYIAQQRLKRPGAWWRVDHAEYMLALRINRINGDWAAYWDRFGKTGSPAKSEPTSRITKIRSVTASLWIAPRLWVSEAARCAAADAASIKRGISAFPVVRASCVCRTRSSEPMIPVSILLKSWAMPPVS